MFSVKYDNNGKILQWIKGNSLKSAETGKHNHTVVEGEKIYNNFGIVAKFPKEVLEHDESWAFHNLVVSEVHQNGTVDVCLKK